MTEKTNNTSQSSSGTTQTDLTDTTKTDSQVQSPNPASPIEKSSTPTQK